jgi:hypothetical protein
MTKHVTICLLLAMTMVAWPIAACDSEVPPPWLRPTNTFFVVANSQRPCSETPGACIAGEAIHFSLGSFFVQLDCTTHSFEWDFGDGSTATGTALATTHTYRTSGVYHAKLAVTGSDTLQLDGSSKLILTQDFTVGVAVPLFSNTGRTLLGIALSLSALSLLKR